MMFCLHMVAEGRPTIEFIMLVNMPSYWTALLGPIVVIFSVQNYRKFVWRLLTCHKQQQRNPTKTIVVGPTTASSIFSSCSLKNALTIMYLALKWASRSSQWIIAIEIQCENWQKKKLYRYFEREFLKVAKQNTLLISNKVPFVIFSFLFDVQFYSICILHRINQYKIYFFVFSDL